MEQKPAAPIVPQKKKSTWWRLTAWILLLGFILIQFFQVDKNNNSISLQNDITAVVTIPDAVQVSLQAACYDCHSNNTRYPWYTNIQPVGWWLEGHIADGKRHLNFHEFASYTPGKQKEKLDEIAESIREGWMPINSYTWIHDEARLSKLQKDQIFQWVAEAKKNIPSGQ